MVFGIADMHLGLGDMNSYTPDVFLGAPLAPVKVGCGEGRPDIPHPCNHTVSL